MPADAAAQHLAWNLMPKQLLDQAGALDQARQVDAGGDPQLVEQVYQILAANVARRSWGKRAAADAADAGVEAVDAHL